MAEQNFGPSPGLTVNPLQFVAQPQLNVTSDAENTKIAAFSDFKFIIGASLDDFRRRIVAAEAKERSESGDAPRRIELTFVGAKILGGLLGGGVGIGR